MIDSSNTSDSPSVFARLIENWLINTSERGFEHPFCQLLIGDGHEIVHIDSHSPREDGKDVISVDKAGTLRGFQLKAGDINVERWRSEVEPELRELAEFPVHHPKHVGQFCQGALVTTGTLNENTLHKLTMLNESIVARGVGQPIELIDRNSLVDRFLKCEDAVLPSEPAGFRAFLQLVLADGTECLDHDLFASVLDGLLPDPGKKPIRTGEAKRLIAGSLLIANHGLATSVAANNHLAVAEGWTIAAARVARAAVEHSFPAATWKPSFALAVLAARRAMEALEAEALADPRMMSGNVLGDGGPVWRTRTTLVAGAIAANRLMKRLSGEPISDESPQIALIEQLRPNLLIWGESAVPYFLALYWYLRSFADRTIKEEQYLAFGVLRALVKANNRRGRRVGVPSPYYRPEACLRSLLFTEENDDETEAFGGSVHTALPIAAILVRALRRQALGILWPDIVDLSHCWMADLKSSDFLRYRSTSGTFKNRFLPRPTRWTELLAEVALVEEEAEAKLPEVFSEDPSFALLFLLVHPHRLNLHSAIWLDKRLTFT